MQQAENKKIKAEECPPVAGTSEPLFLGVSDILRESDVGDEVDKVLRGSALAKLPMLEFFFERPGGR